MSVFRCNKCENYVDGDYNGCFEDPNNDTENLCEDCHIEVIDLKNDAEKLMGISFEEFVSQREKELEIEEELYL